MSIFTQFFIDYKIAMAITTPVLPWAYDTFFISSSYTMVSLFLRNKAKIPLFSVRLALFSFMDQTNVVQTTWHFFTFSEPYQISFVFHPWQFFPMSYLPSFPGMANVPVLQWHFYYNIHDIFIFKRSCQISTFYFFLPRQIYFF